MKTLPRRVSTSAAVILCALLSFSVVGPAVAAADTGSTTTSTTIPTSTTPPTSTTTTTTTVAPPVAPAVAPTTSTVATTPPAPSTTVTTVDPGQLASLINGLNQDMAQAQAVSAYQAAETVASTLGAGATAPPGTDPILVEAAAAQLQAEADLAAAQQRYQQAENRIAAVAIDLYLGAQVGSAGNAIIDYGDRDAYLSSALDNEEQVAEQAKKDYAEASAAANKSRAQAIALIQSRTEELQAQALQASTAANAAAETAANAGGSVSPSLLTQESPTILGPSVLTANELVGWYNAAGHQANLTVTLPTLAADFESVGATSGVRGDIAFAQSVVETDYFGFPSFGQVSVAANNFAGIGACDSCARGLTFPNAVTGVEAQMQLLHSYATTGPAIPGPLPGPFTVADCCPTWMALSGVWATNPEYGVEILRVYQSMVQWALARRTAAAQL